MLSTRIERILLNPRLVLGLYVLLTIIVTFQHYFKGPTSYNNYLIFVKPYFNLLEGKNLYLPYPEYYDDTYKYSPVFALFMAPFALMPNWLGLLAWNALNNAVFYTAGRRLFPDVRRQLLFLLLCLIDMMTALHNSQANCLLVGLMLWTFINLENQKYGWAALCVALAALIKVYGIGIGLIFLFYPLPIRNGIIAFAWMALLAFSPLLVVSWVDFRMIYQGWFDIVRESATGIQLSLMGVLETWFGVAPTAKGIVQGIGMLLLLAPLAYFRAWREADYRRLYVASILIFVVIFNQMAESPTFIIAVAGFMFWFILYRRSTPLGWALFALAFIFTTLSATDLNPPAVRHAYFDVYKLKAVPMILAWVFIQSQLLLYPRWRARLRAAAEASAAEPEQAVLA
ncbi:glycosyltransferase family 87 protein [Hymenobacter algoricola]|uniref:Glycosyltransferase family 87 protein n=1 Tax=Hymenobacter algoricola TaxID=486267 RepID=A0ABP7N7M3_9BACT